MAHKVGSLRLGGCVWDVFNLSRCDYNALLTMYKMWCCMTRVAGEWDFNWFNEV